MKQVPNDTKISKFLSYILRHEPHSIGLVLDGQGWADVETLLRQANAHGVALDRAKLEHIVASNAKKRFAFDESGQKIRASQGHSVSIDLGYAPQQPPQYLYHGTAVAHLDSILQHGLQKRSRHHVHLSRDTETALKVGQRHGKATVLTVLAEKMAADGLVFYVSENGVWLTDHVPPDYLSIENEA